MDILRENVAEIVSATSQLELIQGPYLPVQNYFSPYLVRHHLHHALRCSIHGDRVSQRN